MEIPTNTPEIDNEVLKTPEEWIKDLFPETSIIDADGWIGSESIPLYKPISREDFQKSLAMSGDLSDIFTDQ